MSLRGICGALIVIAVVAGCGSGSGTTSSKPQAALRPSSPVAKSTSAPKVTYDPAIGRCHGPDYRPTMTLQVPGYDAAFAGLETDGKIDLYVRDVANDLPRLRVKATATVVTPGGGISTASRVVRRADTRTTKTYDLMWPQQFTGDTSIKKGVYTVIWTLPDGHQIACSGFVGG